MKPVVARLVVYPFKALDPAVVTAATLVDRGALRYDRAYALVDAQGDPLNGKREPRVHQLRVLYDDGLTAATFASPRCTAPFVFRFGDDPNGLCAWLAHHFERPVALRHDPAGGFPDDTRAPGPTVVSRATLAAVAGWFPDLGADDVARRLRANVEIDGVPAFWEDRLFGRADEVVPFRIGEVVLEGTNPCARCVVPSRDPGTGQPIAAFAKVVAERRAATLPPWAESSRFDHFYRLTVNTRAAAGQVGRAIRVGDAVEPLVASVR